jgi:hypothetical protein
LEDDNEFEKQGKELLAKQRPMVSKEVKDNSGRPLGRIVHLAVGTHTAITTRGVRKGIFRTSGDASRAL